MALHPLLETELGADALEKLCAPDKLKAETALSLVEAVRSQAGRARRRGLFEQFDLLLTNDE